MWVPETLRPEPDPDFVKRLKAIDPSLRVVFGYQRYFEKRWVIERKLTSEQYHNAYKSLLESGVERFVDQPVFDTNKPIIDEQTGEVTTYEQIGVNKYDLAPEWEWFCFADHLNEDLLMQIRRSYAWYERHPISRAKFEMEQEQQAYREAQQKKHADVIEEGIDEAFSALRKKVTFGYGETRNERDINGM